MESPVTTDVATTPDVVAIAAFVRPVPRLAKSLEELMV